MIQNTVIINEIRKLNVFDRLNIITDIWDEIKESKDLEPVSEKEKQLLLNRLAKYKANPDSAIDWTQLKQEVSDKLQQDKINLWQREL